MKGIFFGRNHLWSIAAVKPIKTFTSQLLDFVNVLSSKTNKYSRGKLNPIFHKNPIDLTIYFNSTFLISEHKEHVKQICVYSFEH